MATEYVTKSLKAPTTASFGGFWEYQDPNEHVQYLGDGGFRVTGFVDAKNPFGVKIRNRFVCELKYEGDGIWHCTRLTFNE